jgi:bis(5'-nucleosyl)-tetraphosphatase (symmetrical)
MPSATCKAALSRSSACSSKWPSTRRTIACGWSATWSTAAPIAGNPALSLRHARLTGLRAGQPRPAPAGGRNNIERLKKGDTLREILEAPDRRPARLAAPAKLCTTTNRDRLVHAGIPPQWTLRKALKYAAEVEALRDDNLFQAVPRRHVRQRAGKWDSDLTGVDRLRVITNYFTRMRFCTADGKLDLKSKEGLDTAPRATSPGSSTRSAKPAAREDHLRPLGRPGRRCPRAGRLALDTGCVWGGAMTLMNVDSGERHRCDAPARAPPAPPAAPRSPEGTAP